MDVDQFNRIAERVESRLQRSIQLAELRQTWMYRAVVLSVHGIRSRGEWQNYINRPLTDAGFLHQPIDIGAIGLGSAWRPRTASRAAQQVADHYYRLRNRAPKVMAIGHSFGSLAIGKALQVNPTCRISRVILWGSVLRVSFPWTTLADNRQVSEVLNEACPRDWVSHAACLLCVLHGGGRSGALGFEQADDSLVFNRFHTWTNHDRLGTEMYCEDIWVPFLHSGHPAH